MTATDLGDISRVVRRHRFIAYFAAVALSFALCLAPRPGHAFSIEVHHALTKRALADRLDLALMVLLDAPKLTSFWVWAGRAFADVEFDTSGDGEAFRARFPDPSDFDRIGVRSFLGFNTDPERSIWGISKFIEVGDTMPIELAVRASAWPDQDGRNRDRVALDDERKPMKLADGRPVPADPMALNMGSATGLSSQAHAHYQLAADAPSDDPNVLREAPWNFVVAAGFPGGVETYAGQMAQLHLDVAVLIRDWGEAEQAPGWEGLALIWLGAGLHYVQDAAGPLHNVQVGSYALFEAAKKAEIARALLTGGGTWGELPSFVSIGMGYLNNMHLLGEQWLRGEVAAVAAGRDAHPMIADIMQPTNPPGDDGLQADLEAKIAPFLQGKDRAEPWQDGRGAGSIIVEELALLGSREGGKLYDALHVVAAPRLLQIGETLGDEEAVGPEHFRSLDEPGVAAAMATIAELHANSLRRALTAARLYHRVWETANADSAARRLRRSRLSYLAASDARRQQYVDNPPAPSEATVHQPSWLAGEVGVLVFLLGCALLMRWLWRRRSRPGAAGATP